MNTKSIISMAVTGALVGGGIGYFFCTSSGKEKLEQLTSGKVDFKEIFKNVITNFFSGMIASAKSNLNGTGDEEPDKETVTTAMGTA